MRAFEDRGQRGLYDPVYEHDACGVGAVCRLDGGKSHDVIQKGLEILVNLTHRGACGSDATTGDGAGILMQVPHAFLADRCGEIGIRLPDLGEYGVGVVFLPTDAVQRKDCMDRFEAAVKAEGQVLLGWRDVPTVSDALGEVARSTEPAIKQVFIVRGAGLTDAAAFDASCM